MENQSTLSDGTVTESACSRLLIAGMLPTVQAVQGNTCPINTDPCLP